MVKLTIYGGRTGVIFEGFLPSYEPLKPGYFLMHYSTSHIYIYIFLINLSNYYTPNHQKSESSRNTAHVFWSLSGGDKERMMKT